MANGGSRCGAVLCPLPGIRGAHSAALRPAGDYAPHGDVWPARLFASFFAGSVQLLPVRDPHAEAARAAASLDTALDTAAG